MYSRLYFGVINEMDYTVVPHWIHNDVVYVNDVVYCFLSFDSVEKLNNRITHPRPI